MTFISNIKSAILHYKTLGKYRKDFSVFHVYYCTQNVMVCLSHKLFLLLKMMYCLYLRFRCIFVY